MDLILWRHAEAHALQEGQSDLARCLTTRGEKHAARMAQWLEAQLPEGVRVLSSPALRAQQTAQALGRKFKVKDALSPGAEVADVLATVGWPTHKAPVLVVGHQPTLGAVVSQLFGMGGAPMAMRKGAVWWLRSRQREGQWQCLMVAVVSPDRL